MKDFRINEAKQEKFEENKTDFLNNKTFHVVRTDDSVIEMGSDVETFVAAIKEAGIERVMGLNLTVYNEPIISKSINPKHRQVEIGNGLRVMLLTRGYLMHTLEMISNKLNLDWLVLEDNEEFTDDMMSSHEHGMKTLVLLVDKEELTAVVTGQKKVYELELSPFDASLLVKFDDEGYILNGDEQKGEAVVTKKYDAIRFCTDHSRKSDSALVKIEKTISFFMRDGNGNVMFEGDPDSGKDYWPYTMIEYHLGDIVEQNIE